MFTSSKTAYVYDNKLSLVGYKGIWSLSASSNALHSLSLNLNKIEFISIKFL